MKLILFGSGEIASTGRKVHEQVLAEIGKKDVSIVLISTPAGFQPNVRVVHEEIAEFFVNHLTNYHPKVEIVYANNRALANDESVIKPLISADYIFTGPGSPSYAVEHFQDTRLLALVLQQVRAGVPLALSSAATIAFSKHALPVYEIYKVGTSLHWLPGLNFYQEVYKELTVIPHFNNTEGGEKTDTSHCYMGEERFEKLLKLLPKGERVVGIDEHTALIIDTNSKQEDVVGKGKIHLI